MTTSKYFSHYDYKPTQQVVEDIAVETIQLAGMDLIYIKRDSVDPDYLYNEDVINTFTQKFTIEMMIESIDGFGGDTELMSKFGLEIKDRITLVAVKSRVEKELGSIPFEGDLIYIPMTKSLFEIKKIDDDEPFYQIGQNVVYTFICELFAYAQEDINVGDAQIDNLISDLDISSDTDNESSYENDEIEDEANLYDQSDSVFK